MVAHSITLLQQGIHNPEVLEEFKQFLRREAKTTIEQSEFYEYQWRKTQAHLRTEVDADYQMNQSQRK